MYVDILIVGSGIAGLNASLNIPKEFSSLIITKDDPWECNTFYAQGGIATAKDSYDVEAHIADTIYAGAGLCDIEAVRIMSNESIGAISSLIERGMKFDKIDNKLHYTKEAAHSQARILHANGDATGRDIHLFLMQQNRSSIMTNSVVIDILREDDRVYGVTIYREGVISNIYCKFLILASGGVGSLYKYHTNARSISADVQGIAIEKGIELIDMEMLQFHPTVFVKNEWARKYLLTEALRGEGAFVVDEKNYRFLFDYDSKGELAPRDVVSRAIFDYKKRTNSEVYLSFEAFSEDFFIDRFPNIYRNLKEMGFSIPKDKVPISPAFHYSMGGIKTDSYGRVGTIKNLYAIGEVACMRVHGGNRLASNSLLEGLVFSKRAVLDIVNRDLNIKKRKFREGNFIFLKPNDKDTKNSLRDIMWDSVGIQRERNRLKEALNFVDEFLERDNGRLLYLRLLSAKKIIESAIERKESLGAHYLI